ncbi:DNA polymerase III sliding clamp [Mycobacterium phage NiebruSaylor]|nr:DNA polymerase III sliding clamp beta [Mycobacterium phage Vorrps]QFP97126.1 DNA polymerase III sliding clamp [Mycobacterium phage Krili]QOC58512.1 DNA polymerase III sliding clamp [Mycobacterium phage Shida]QOC59279.1 DNA polymerase III sliding clamp [Mycobacterium phage NiebruSaylor]
MRAEVMFGCSATLRGARLPVAWRRPWSRCSNPEHPRFPTREERRKMSRELKVRDGVLTPEVAWLAKMSTGAAPASALIRVTALVGALVLRRTNMDLFQESVIPVEGAAQATVLVEAGKLLAGLKSVSGMLVLTVNDDELIIKSSDATVKVRAANVEYPIWPEFESTADQAIIGTPQLTQVLTSAGTDESMPQFMVVSFDAGQMVTTDRFRLSRINYGPSEFRAVAPTAALKAMSKSQGVVYVEPGKVGDADWIELSSAGRTVLAPMPQQDLFKWQHLIPKDPPVQVALSRRDLLDAAGGDEVTISVAPDAIRVTSHSDGVEVERTLKPLNIIKHELDGPLVVRMRSKYLNEALRGIDTGTLLMAGSAGNRPVMFQDVSESDLHLIMPVRVAG